MKKCRFPSIFGNFIRCWFGAELCGISDMSQSCYSQLQLGCWAIFCGVLRVLSHSSFCSSEVGSQIRELILASLSEDLNQETRTKLRASHPIEQEDMMLLCSSDQSKSFPSSIVSVFEQYFFWISFAMLFCRHVVRLILARTGVRSLTVPRTVSRFHFLSPSALLCFWRMSCCNLHDSGLFSTLSDLECCQTCLLVLCPSRPFIGNHRKPLFYHVHLLYQQTAEQHSPLSSVW